MWWWCYAGYLFYKIGFKMCPTLCPTMCPNGAHGAHVLLCPTFHIFNKYMKYKASYLTLYSCGWSCRSYNKILDLPQFVPHFVPHYVPQWGTWGTCLLYPTFHICVVSMVVYCAPLSAPQCAPMGAYGAHVLLCPTIYPNGVSGVYVLFYPTFSYIY